MVSDKAVMVLLYASSHRQDNTCIRFVVKENTARNFSAEHTNQLEFLLAGTCIIVLFYVPGRYPTYLCVCIYDCVEVDWCAVGGLCVHMCMCL